MSVQNRIFDHELVHPDGRCRIISGVSILNRLAEFQADWFAGRTVFFLSTPRLRELYGSRLADLHRLAGRAIELEVEDGEGAKTLAHAERLWNQMLDLGGKRDSRLVTFGGGSVGDLGGFVAGCFLRGIRYAQIPTTLLAQVDAAIGGKTAVDMPGGKNTVGCFHHPDWVLSDTSLLATLPVGELRSGLVEVVKMAYLLDLDLLARVESDLDALLNANAGRLAPVVAAAAAAKSSVVTHDPKEGDRRRLLNFGHTLGHAIEGVLAYRNLRHGEAVAYGLLFVLRLAVRRGLPVDQAQRLIDLLARFDFPALPDLSAEALLEFVARDKKATEQGTVWVLPAEIGRGSMEPIPAEEVRAELPSFLAAPWSRSLSPASS